MDEIPPAFLERKTATHKQIIGGVGIAAALYFLPQLKALFVTREEGIAQSAQILEVKKSIDDLKDDLTHKIERGTDKIVERIKETEERSTKNVDRVERRVDALEALHLIDPKSKKITN